MNDEKIELKPGFWKTRSGHKVKIVSIENDIPIEITNRCLGYFVSNIPLDPSKRTYDRAEFWALDGRIGTYDPPYAADIVEPWVEKKEILPMYIVQGTTGLIDFYPPCSAPDLNQFMAVWKIDAERVK